MKTTILIILVIIIIPKILLMHIKHEIYRFIWEKNGIMWFLQKVLIYVKKYVICENIKFRALIITGSFHANSTQPTPIFTRHPLGFWKNFVTRVILGQKHDSEIFRFVSLTDLPLWWRQNFKFLQKCFWKGQYISQSNAHFLC